MPLSHTSHSRHSSSRRVGARRTLGATATAVGLTLSALALPAAAGSSDDDADFGHAAPARVERPDPAPNDVRPVPVPVRPVDVRPDERPETDIEVLRLECRPATQFDNAIGCAWGDVMANDAVGYQLWRIVDRGERELVWRGGLDTTEQLDRVPGDALVVRYAILAVDADGEIVARSRAERVVLPADEPRPVRPQRTAIRSVR